MYRSVLGSSSAPRRLSHLVLAQGPWGLLVTEAVGLSDSAAAPLTLRPRSVNFVGTPIGVSPWLARCAPTGAQTVGWGRVTVVHGMSLGLTQPRHLASRCAAPVVPYWPPSPSEPRRVLRVSQARPKW